MSETDTKQTERAKTTLSVWPVIALSLVPLIMVLGNSMLIPILPTMQEQLHISKLQVSLVITLFSVPAGIIIPFAGYLSDRYGRKNVIIPSLVLYALGGLVAGLSAWLSKNPYWMIMLGRVLQGAGAAGTAPITMALISDIFRGDQRSKVLGINEAANGLGKVLSPILGVLVAMIVWYAAFFTFPILCSLSVLLLWFLIKEPAMQGEPQPFSQYMQTLKIIFKREWKWLLTAYFAGACALFILFGVLFYLSQLLEEQYRIDGIPKGGILAVPLLAMASTSYITGIKIKKRFGLMKWLVVTGFFLLAGSLASAAFFRNPYVLLFFLVISGIGTGLTLPCLNTLITSAVSKEERGIVTSFYGAVRFFGVAFGPPIFTWLIDVSRVFMFLTVSGLALLVGLLSMWLIRPRSPNKGGTDQPRKQPDHIVMGKRRVFGRIRARV
jgi:ACDE family multidrug resistance protein